MNLQFDEWIHYFSVKLERLTSNALLPSLQRLKIIEDLARLLGNNEQANANKTEIAQALDEAKRSDYEEVIIGWQQKLFSRVCAYFFFHIL